MNNFLSSKQFAIYSVLGTLIVVCILFIPFFKTFSNELAYKHISSTDYRLNISKPSKESDYILSQNILSDYHSNSSSVSTRRRTQPVPHVPSLNFEIDANTRGIRIDIDTEESTIDIGQLCFLARLLPTQCWQFSHFPSQNQVTLSFFDSETGRSIESTWSLHHLEASTDTDQSSNKDYEAYVLNYSDLTAIYRSKSRVESMALWGATHYKNYGLVEGRYVPDSYVAFVKTGHDPYLESNKYFLNSVGSEWFKSSDLVSKIYYWSFLILIVIISFILLALILRFIRFARTYYSSRQYLNAIRHIFLGVIIVFSFSIAIKGIDYGDHFDEYSYVDIEKQMLERVSHGGALLPNWYLFPSLTFYLGLLPIVPEIVNDLVPLNRTKIDQFRSSLSKTIDARIGSSDYSKYGYILETRLITIACYILSIFLIYLIVLRLCSDWKEATIAAAFFALSWEANYHFRMFTPDPIMVPFVLITFYFLLSAPFQYSYYRFLRLACISAGLACGAKYTAVFLGASIFCASAYLFFQREVEDPARPGRSKEFSYDSPRSKSTTPLRNLGSFLLMQIRLSAWVFLAYLLTTPGTLLEPVTFLENLAYQEYTYRVTGGGGYSVWLLPDKLSIIGTYFSASVFSHYVWISITASLLALVGIGFFLRRTYPALVLFPFIVCSFVMLVSYNIIYLRNFLFWIPLYAIFAARGFFVLNSQVATISQKSDFHRNRFLPTVIFIIPVSFIMLNGYWLWSSANSIVFAQPTEQSRLNCSKTFSSSKPMFSRCNAYPNKNFRDQQISELFEFLNKNTSKHYVFSEMLDKEIKSRGLLTPDNVISIYEKNAYAVYYSREPFKEPDKVHLFTVGANRFNHYQLLPSGPHDVNFTYYPTWPGPNRIVIAPLKETFEEAGSIFSLKD